MTVICDSKKRVTLPGAQPGDAFAVEFASDGSVVLRKLVPFQRRVETVRTRRRIRLRSRTPISVGETLQAIEKHAL